MDSRIVKASWTSSRATVGMAIAATTAIAVAAPALALVGGEQSATASTAVSAASATSAQTMPSAAKLSARKPTWLQTYDTTTELPNGRMDIIRVKSWLAANGTYLQLDGGRVDFEGVTAQFPLSRDFSLTWKQVRALPNDIDVVRTTINRGLFTGVRADSVVGPLAGLSAGPLSPEVRSLVVQVLAENKNVVTDKDAVDSRGRIGVSAEQRVGDMVYRAVFAPDATLLEFQVTQSGKLIDRQTYLSIGASAKPKVSAALPPVDKKKK